jgi:transposase
MAFNTVMIAYSLDLRARIVDAVERQIGSKRQIAVLFGVHESFIYKLLRQKRDRGTIAPLPHGGGAHAKLSAAQLRRLPDWVAAMPDATLDELREQLKKQARVVVSLSTICRGLQALGLSRKKVPARVPSRPPRASRIPRETKDAGEGRLDLRG